MHVMHLYDRTWINRAGLRVLGWTKDTPNPFVGVIERDASGNPTGPLVATIGLPALLGRFAALGGRRYPSPPSGGPGRPPCRIRSPNVVCAT